MRMNLKTFYFKILRYETINNLSLAIPMKWLCNGTRDYCYCLPDEITRFLREKENSDKSIAKLWHCQIDKIEYLDEVWDKIKKMVMQEELSKYED